MPSSVCSSRSSVEDLRLDRHVERRGGLVGDQQRRAADQRQRDHHALAHAAGKLVRVLVEALRGGRDSDCSSMSQRARRAAAARSSRSCWRERLGDLLADA